MTKRKYNSQNLKQFQNKKPKIEVSDNTEVH
jgi:hypothetical protein